MREYDKTLPTDKQINLFMNKSIFNYIKIYRKENNLTLKRLFREIIFLGWERYKTKNNIKI